MSNFDRLERLRDLLLVFLAAFACYHNFAAFREYVFEDAYITYRYADNLAAGAGFVFNPGERVLGTSTPLWTLVLALAGRLGFDVPTASGFLTALCLSLVALTGAWILKRLGFPNLGAVLASLILWGTGEILGFWGMETAFFSLLLLTSLAFAFQGRPALTGILLGLACLTRYDGIVFAGVLLLVLWVRTGKAPWLTAVASASVVVPWIIFSWAYFGSLLPNTLAAKGHTVGMGEYIAESWPRLELRFFSPFYRFGLHFARHQTLFALLGLTLLAPIVLRARRLIKRDDLLIVMSSYPILLFLSYAYIGPPPAHQWYLIPGMYFLLTLSLAAWGDLTGRWRFRRATALSIALLVWSLYALPSKVREEATRFMARDYYRSKVEAYSFLARWITDHGLSDLKLFTREPGYLTYLSKNPVVDGAGLVTRGIRYHGSEFRTPLEKILADHHPELAVIVDVPNEVARLKGFLPLYQTRTKALFIRKDVLSKRYDSLAADWLSHESPDPDPLAVGHPLRYDFERGNAAGWWGDCNVVEDKRWGRDDGDGRGAYLKTVRGLRGGSIVMSPPFRIDFDQLTFRFAATGGKETTAQLIVNGQVVRTADGRDAAMRGILEIRWPVYHWRGLSGVLRFIDRSGKGVLAADDVESERYRNQVVFDDFESGVFEDRWVSTFGRRPRPLAPLVSRHGLGLISGRYFAASLWDAAKMTMVSRPFVVEREKMAFRLFDFGGDRTEVALVVGEDSVRRWVGQDSMKSLSVIWDLTPFAGQEAVLKIVDRDGRPGKGIGIDDVLFFDEDLGAGRR